MGCMLDEVVCGEALSKCKFFDLRMLDELDSLSCGLVDLFVYSKLVHKNSSSDDCFVNSCGRFKAT